MISVALIFLSRSNPSFLLYRWPNYDYTFCATALGLFRHCVITAVELSAILGLKASQLETSYAIIQTDKARMRGYGVRSTST